MLVEGCPHGVRWRPWEKEEALRERVAAGGRPPEVALGGCPTKGTIKNSSQRKALRHFHKGVL